MTVLRGEAKSHNQQAEGHNREELSNFFQLPQSKTSITFHTMFRRIAPFLLLSVFSAYGQEPARTSNALQDLSSSTEVLSRKVSRSVVQIFSTGYSFNTEEAGSTNTSLVTRQRSTGSGVILSPRWLHHHQCARGSRRAQSASSAVLRNAVERHGEEGASSQGPDGSKGGWDRS